MVAGWFILQLVALCVGLGSTIEAPEDLYKLLGVPRTATTKAIKQAYRRKALETHPDKQKQLPADEAAEAFRQVVHAFEILSDVASRQRYDRTGSSQPTQNSNQGFDSHQQYAQHFRWNFRRQPVRLKDQFQVQEAQTRVLHVVSLEQLQTIMLDEDERLERNLLLSFVVPGVIEKHVNDEMVFPYPFAAMSSQGIWWEDLLQTVQIRFHKSSELSRFFQVDAGQMQNDSNTPIFLFGKRGQSLTDSAARIQTRSRQSLENWVWKQMEVDVQFINQHDEHVELYWIHGSRAQLKFTIPPHSVGLQTSMLSHEWYARDARVDSRSDSPGRYKLSTESSLGSWKIVNDTSPQKFVIEPQTCFDLSGHCAFWKQRGECRKNPNFMLEQCLFTCDLCRKENDANGKTINDEL